MFYLTLPTMNKVLPILIVPSGVFLSAYWLDQEHKNIMMQSILNMMINSFLKCNTSHPDIFLVSITKPSL